jgi:uncharacterized metal-binding protein YceD (DUF177 family)
MSATPWSCPIVVAEIPETGRHVDLVADEPARAALAKVAGVVGLPRVEAAFDLTRHGADGVHVVGHLSATVEQNCVRTLEPMESQIEEHIDLVFAPQSEAANGVARAAVPDSDEPPERLRDGAVDLGAVATEFLLLGIDPYPRKPGSVFNAPKVAENPAAHPFAALAAWKNAKRDNDN